MAICRSRDTEVCPGEITYELLEEEASGNRPRRSPTNILEVGEVTIELWSELIPEWELPTPFASRLTCSEELIYQGLVGAHQSSRMVTQCDDTSTCKGCGIDDRGGFIPLCVGEGVSQDQTALGIGIDHLDRLPEVAPNDIPRLERLP